MIRSFVAGLALFVCGLLCLDPPARAWWQSIQQVAISGGGGNPFVLIANTSASNQNAPIDAPAVDSTGGNFIIVSFSQYQGVAHGTVTDNKGNTYSPLTAQSTANEAYVQFYYKASPTVGTNHIITVDNGAGGFFGAIAVQVWAGANVSPIDVQNGATTLGATSLATGNVTPSGNNSLIVSAVSSTTGSSGSYSVGGGFTITDNIPVAPNVEGLAMAWLKQNTAAVAGPTWGWTGTVDAAAVIVVIKP